MMIQCVVFDDDGLLCKYIWNGLYGYDDIYIIFERCKILYVLN